MYFTRKPEFVTHILCLAVVSFIIPFISLLLSVIPDHVNDEISLITFSAKILALVFKRTSGMPIFDLVSSFGQFLSSLLFFDYSLILNI